MAVVDDTFWLVQGRKTDDLLGELEVARLDSSPEADFFDLVMPAR
jgi:hypothetical protein